MSGLCKILMAQVEDIHLFTAQHCQHVGHVSYYLAKAAGFRDNQLSLIHTAAVLHDIGKLAVPRSLLDKPTTLLPEERALIERHVLYAHDWLYSYPPLRSVARIIRGHHEKLDGTGYPDGLTADKIPQESKIITIADVWDALANQRPWREAMEKKEARELIRAGAGTQFDARLVEVFLTLDL